MNVLIDIAHPAHVHLLKNAFFELKKRNKVIVTVKNVPAAIELLDCYKIPYIYLGGKKNSIGGKALWQLIYNLKLFFIVLTNRIDIGIGTSITIPQISRITKMKSIVLDDDDDDVEPLFVKYGHKFADIILSPSCIKRSSFKNIPYNGYHELAYLHPNYFKPDESILDELKLSKNERYFVLRFNSFKAHHDTKAYGISCNDKKRLVECLSKYGRVLITTEGEIEPDFLKFQIKLSSDKIHSLLFFATMFVGDSQTMTSEAAILGTPAFKCNTFAGRLSVPNELEHKFKLCFSYTPDNFNEFLTEIERILISNNSKEVFKLRRVQMLQEKIDVTSFFIWTVENFALCKSTYLTK